MMDFSKKRKIKSYQNAMNRSISDQLKYKDLVIILKIVQTYLSLEVSDIVLQFLN